MIPNEVHTCSYVACIAVFWWLVDLAGIQAFFCLSRSPLGIAENSGFGRLGTKNTVLEARVQVLNPVPPTCSDFGDSLWDVVERLFLFRPDDP